MRDTTPLELVEAYLDHLDEEEFTAAADLFTEEATYLHPPSYGNPTRIQGRDAIERYFAEVRGPRDAEHEIDDVALDGDSNRVGIIGRVHGPDVEEYHFLGFARTTGSLIDFYAAARVR